MRGFFVTILVLAAILAAVDVGARLFAQDRLATELGTRLELPTEPDVTIRGFPFLTQLAGGRLTEVELSSAGARFGDLENLTIVARLQGVALPVQALIDGQVDEIVADTVVAEARVSPADLARLLDTSEITAEPVTAAELDTQIAAAEADPSGLSGRASELREVDPADSVRLRTTAQAAGQAVPVAVIASFAVEGGQVSLRGRDVSTDAEVPGPAAEAAAGVLRDELVGRSVTVDPGELPFGIRPTGLSAQDGMLVVVGRADDVDVLAGAGA